MGGSGGGGGVSSHFHVKFNLCYVRLSWGFDKNHLYFCGGELLYIQLNLCLKSSQSLSLASKYCVWVIKDDNQNTQWAKYCSVVMENL